MRENENEYTGKEKWREFQEVGCEINSVARKRGGQKLKRDIQKRE